MLEESPKCFSCSPKESKAQLEVLHFVQSLGLDVASNDRTAIAPKELDVWVPSRRFAVEYNGLYWHSAAVLADPAYHDSKARACAAAGIRLLSVYEDEWRDRRALVESMIRHRLGLSARGPSARRCTVAELTSRQVQGFFGANHLEGHARSRVAFGLVGPTGDLLAAMSLRRPFHRRYADSLEVARSCCLAGASVAGWLGRLTAAARAWSRAHGVARLVTYVDGRVGQGRAYDEAGWSLLSSSSSPRFWWTDHVNRFNRFQYKADKANSLTQAQVADRAGVVQIFGCSNTLWGLVP